MGPGTPWAAPVSWCQEAAPWGVAASPLLCLCFLPGLAHLSSRWEWLIPGGTAQPSLEGAETVPSLPGSRQAERCQPPGVLSWRDGQAAVSKQASHRHCRSTEESTGRHCGPCSPGSWFTPCKSFCLSNSGRWFLWKMGIQAARLLGICGNTREQVTRPCSPSPELGAGWEARSRPSSRIPRQPRWSGPSATRGHPGTTG